MLETKPEEAGPKRGFVKKLMDSFTKIMIPPISRYITLGASFRYFGQFASDYYLPLFYLTMYPGYRAQFAILYSIINVACGFISSIAGGMITDRFGQGKPMMKSWVCIYGNVLAIPFYLASVLITGNFYLSMACTALRFLIGEPWRSPSVTMI